MTFHKAAVLAMDAATGLRAGDALHLACALDAKAHGIVILDSVMANNAKRLKLKPVAILRTRATWKVWGAGHAG